MSIRPYYELQIYVDTYRVNLDTISKYMLNISNQQKLVEQYKCGEVVYIDAGFDLFIPTRQIISENARGQKVNMAIKCSMNFIQSSDANDFSLNTMPVGYYLYPRSSTGSKTSLRLSNSVGIIDAGYRGDIMALFDNIALTDHNLCPAFGTEYIINENDRLVQICAPNITYPIYPILVNSEEELGLTSRGYGGFGSTGK